LRRLRCRAAACRTCCRRIEQAGSVTLDRLHLLVQKGYQPDFGGEAFGAVWLYHPRESSGLVTSPSAKSDEFSFGREETEAFNRFLQTVPSPSFWERTRRGRINVYAWLFLGALCFGAAIGVMAAVGLVKAFW
jgi:hypothetical protein